MMRTALSWIAGLLSLAACGAVIFLLTPKVPLNVPHRAGSPQVSAEPVECADSSIDVQLPVDVLTGRFMVLENRPWTIQELKGEAFVHGRELPIVWGAGRLLAKGTRTVRLAQNQSLGYSQTKTRWMTMSELSAVEKLPRLAGLSYDPADQLGPAEHQRALAIPGLRYFQTDEAVLSEVSLPGTIEALSVIGAVPQWTFPFITSFESFSDYRNEPVPLPRNLPNVEFLVVESWPEDLPLPPRTRLLSAETISPCSLSGSDFLEWVDVWHFECDSGSEWEHFAGQPAIRRLRLDCAGVSDVALQQLSTATQLESLVLDLRDSCVTDVGLSALCRLPRLDTLTLEGEIDLKLLSGLAGCSSVSCLSVSMARVGDEEMKLLASLPGLRKFDLGASRFTGEGLRYFAGRSVDISVGLERLTPEGFRELKSHWPGRSLNLAAVEEFADTDVGFLQEMQHLNSLTLGDGLAPHPGPSQVGANRSRQARSVDRDH